MPRIGLSNPYIAEYVHNGVGGISYRNGMRAGRAVERTFTVENADTDDFYCDNKAGESSGGTFSGGELSLTVAEIMPTPRKVMFGLDTETMTIDGEEVEVIKYDRNMKPKDLGYGDIVKMMVKGKTLWHAMVLRKVKFSIPEDSATTQGETIDWGTESITAKVMRDDSGNEAWQYSATFESESKADSFIRHILNIADPAIEALTITSVAGATTGTTKITVAEEPFNGRTYRYKTGASVTVPELYEDLTSWSAWDGASDIAATTGDKIVIAEIDVTGLAMAAGIATVASKEE